MTYLHTVGWRMGYVWRISMALGAACVLLVGLLMAQEVDFTAVRKVATEQMQKGNFKEAYDNFRKLALNPKDGPLEVSQDLQKAMQCLQQLGRDAEGDVFVEDVVKAHSQNWRLLEMAASQFANRQHFGFVVNGKYERGWRREQTGRQVNSLARDRARALQLLNEARALGLKDEKAAKEVSQLVTKFARALQIGTQGQQESWRLQALSKLDDIPDYEDGHWWGGRQVQGAPVDESNAPVYHKLPESFDLAKTDGERWRALLAEAVKLDPARKLEVDATFASFCYSQFGEQTLQYYGGWRGGDDDGDAQGVYSLETLTDDETIARLATGVKRFKLPDEFNPLKLYRAIAEAGKSQWGEHARDHIARTYLNRRQYVTAAAAWQTAINEYGPGNNNYRVNEKQQIVSNWGRFEMARMQAAGKGAAVDFRFRNGNSVTFEARSINLNELLKDLKQHIKDADKNNGQLDWNRIQLQNVGYQLVVQNQGKYLGEKAAEWTVDLKPRAEHRDSRINVATPLNQAGAYLVIAKMKEGNTSSIVLWVTDTVIAKKPLDQKQLYYVADAVTGTPVAKANVEFFGWRHEYQNNQKPRVITKNFSEFTDADGQVLIGAAQAEQNFQWLSIARTDQGRLAFLGFSHVWFGQQHDPEYHALKTFTITDRPVYRPEQSVKFKLWLREAKYDQPDKSEAAGRAVKVLIHNGQQQKVYEQAGKLDEFGGISGEFKLPKNAGLGVYNIQLEHLGGSTFRVEEYKKPEFEVSIEAPTEPVQLGEKITATIKAKYYFGAPVAKGKVKYTVKRTNHDARWYPKGDWDWFYGSGYWWFGCDYNWYPGWSKWGCMRPMWPWWGHAQVPPEVVIERETEIGPDGTVKVEIDSLLAKELHPDHDHSYSITAEVVDESRRTIVGSGNVLVARTPFKVFAWVDRGHYRVGDDIVASFQAHTLDQKPVAGKGQLKLFKVSYENNEPVETQKQVWDLSTNEEGRARQQMKAAEPGQYRLSYSVTDTKGHTQEGGYVFIVRGTGFTGKEFRFNDLELVTDKREYAPGEKVKLQVSTDRVGGTILLFVRATNGIYLKPKVIRLTGKSIEEEIAVVQRDMPNFYVEALTISDAQIHTEIREIVVPPEKRVLNVTVTPSSERYKPGQEASVEVKVTGLDGKPHQGDLVLSVYDKSVEYISGGSNEPEIRDYFWKWRRHHHPQTESSLIPYSANLVKQNDPSMRNLGIFGDDIDGEGGLGIQTATRGGMKRKSNMALGAAPGGFGGRAMRMEMAGAAPMMADGVMAPQAARAMNGLAMDKNALRDEALVEAEGAGGGADPALAAAAVRSNFADTAFWASSVKTDKNGVGKVTFAMPENLTGWKIKAWGMGHGTKVGQGDALVVTAKNLLVRLQAPRFFVEKDEVVLSGNVHNYLDVDKDVKVVLELDGGMLAPMANNLVQTVKIKAGGEQRVDWRVKVAAEGLATVRMKALTDAESDAVEQKFPAYVHGMLKTESFSGVVRVDDNKGTLKFKIPEQRRPEQTRLELRYSPTLAGAMVDALPYLVDYPYGCTEQTLNRFLPTVITQRILQKMQLDLAAIRDKRTNLNAQEIGDDKERAKRWKAFDRNPVFDVEEVTSMVKDGVQKLTSMQLSDGGWGWFSGYGEHSYPHTTAVVVHGLQVAVQNDVALVPGTLERGVEWLKRHEAAEVQKLKNAPSKTHPYKVQADDLDAFVFLVLNDAGAVNAEMREFLYRDRIQLSVYAKAMLGLALHKQKQAEQLTVVLQNIEQFVVEDEENQSAYLKLPLQGWWYWHGSDIEANAWYLKLLSATDPKGRRASRLVKYILNNRKNGTYWRSTRDTAYCIESLADYLKASGEDRPDMTIEVLVDGAVKKSVKVDGSNLFSFDNKLVIEGAALASGEHTVEVRRTGTGPVYFNAYVTNFTLEDFITKAGLEVKVNRKFFKLTRDDRQTNVAGSRGQVVSQRVEKFIRTELADLSTVKSGDLIEVELKIDSKNDYEYLLFEDMKAAGTEPVEVRSGYNGNEMHAYVEYRDERVALFVRWLPRGEHSVSYRLRAEIPGKFAALPTKASEMYAPELKANSDEFRLKIED